MADFQKLALEASHDGARAVRIEEILREAGAGRDAIALAMNAVLDDAVFNSVLAKVPHRRILERLTGRGFDHDQIKAAIRRAGQSDHPVGAIFDRVGAAMTAVGGLLVVGGYLARGLIRHGFLNWSPVLMSTLILAGFLLIVYSPIVNGLPMLFPKRKSARS